MPFLVVLLLALVALGLGGYSAWATFLLEMGAAVLATALAVASLSRARTAEEIEISRARKRFPFFFRHPGLGRLLRVFSLGFLRPGIGNPAAEILLPRRDDPPPPWWSAGLVLPLTLLTVWIALSLVALPARWLELLSPQAHALRAEIEAVAPGTALAGSRAPLSVSPFLTASDLWLWLAFVTLFLVSARLASQWENARRLSYSLLLMGAAYGLYGVSQWLTGLHGARASGSETSLWTSASFGNRNHYAVFMEMLFLSGLGWLSYQWLKLRPGARGRQLFRRSHTSQQEAGARIVLAGVGTVLMGLGLVFSLSRSGIAFTLVGTALWAYLGLARTDFTEAVDLGGRSPKRSLRYGPILALVLVVAGTASWIGLAPVMERFRLASDEWEAERGRWPVWRDSAGAVRDFWVTGSGLGTFRYVFPAYRTFGGSTLYSWAHNDYLQLVIELGVPGAVLVGWIVGGIVMRAAVIRRGASDRPAFLALHAGYCAALLAVALHSITDFGLHLPANAALASVVAGMVVGIRPPRKS